MVEACRGEFGKYGYSIPKFEMPLWTSKLMSKWDPKMKELMPMIGVDYECDNTKSKKMMNMTYRDDKKGMVE